MSKPRFIVAIAVACVLVVSADTGAEAAEMPKSLLGTWRVTSVFWRHDGPWPSGTPKQLLLGMIVVFGRTCVSLNPKNAKTNDIPPLYLKDLYRIQEQKHIIKENGYKITSHQKILLIKKRFSRYTLTFGSGYKDFSFGKTKVPCRYCAVSGHDWHFYLVSPTELVIPNYSNIAFMILTRISGPVM